MGAISTENRNAHYLAIQPTLTSSQLQVLIALDAAEPRGLTRYELADRTNRPVSSVCGRINELEKLGLVTEADESRPTPYGGNAVVMRIADAHRTVKQMTMF